MDVSMEELVQTKSVDELRVIAAQVQREADTRQKELQLMVGSRYHEFIESADTISGMHKQSITLVTDLEDFMKACATLVHSGKALVLNRTEDLREDVRDVGALCKPVSAAVVWDALDDCDVFGAAITIVQAALFDAFCSSGAMSSTSKPIVELFCLKSEDKPHTPVYSIVDHSAILFLAETVCHDAQLLLLDLTFNFYERARALACLKFIGGTEPIQCLHKLLQAHAFLIKEQCSGIEDKDISVASLTLKLEQAVRALERAMLDTYLIFFRDSGSLLPSASNASTTGYNLFTVCLLELGSKAEKGFNLHTSAHERSHAVALDIQKARAASEVSVQEELRTSFSRWFMGQIETFGRYSLNALGNVKSAAEVARVQRAVWNQVTVFVSTPSESKEDKEQRNEKKCSEGFPHPLYDCDTWKEACRCLTSQQPSHKSARRGSRGTQSNDDDGALVLWSLLFKSTFLHQVERLLASSGLTALHRFRETLSHTFEQTGLRIAWHESTSSTVLTEVQSQLHVYTTNTSTSTQRGAASSREIEKRAQTLWGVLENEISTLVADSWVPVERPGVRPASNGGLQSGEQFAIVLFHNLCQLAGAVACTLRCVAQSVQTSLLQVVDEHKDWGQRAGSLHLLDALLIIGRLTWMVKCKGKFLKDALTIPSGYGWGSEKIALEQLRLSFLFADTNSDGVLNAEEVGQAINTLPDEAVCALQTSHLAQALTPTLTYAEFLLYCARLVDAPEPMTWFGTCLDDITSFTHEAWGQHMVSWSAAELTVELQSQLCEPRMRGDTQEETFSIARRQPGSFWHNQEVDMDGEGGLVVKQTVCLPMRPSTAISSFLFSVSTKVQSSVVCMDTLRVLPPGFRFRGDIPSLLAIVQQIVYKYTLTFTAAVYRDMISRIVAQRPRKTGTTLGETQREEIFLQLAADVISVQLLCAQHEVVSAEKDVAAETSAIDANSFELFQRHAVRSTNAGMEELGIVLRDTVSHLDPINAELYLPLLKQSMNVWTETTGLLASLRLATPSAQPALPSLTREAIDDSEQLRVCLESLFAVPTSDAKHGRAQAGPLHAAQSPGLHVHTAPRFVLLPVPLRMFNSRMLGVPRDDSFDTVKPSSHSRATPLQPLSSAGVFGSTTLVSSFINTASAQGSNLLASASNILRTRGSGK